MESRTDDLQIFNVYCSMDRKRIHSVIPHVMIMVAVEQKTCISRFDIFEMTSRVDGLDVSHRISTQRWRQGPIHSDESCSVEHKAKINLTSSV